MPYSIRLMCEEDIRQVDEIDREAFPMLWPPVNYHRELRNQLAHYVVAIDEDEVIDEVGVDTTKFIFLTRRPDSHLEFDLDVAKAQSSENPVFYVQYAHARINSIFVNAREKGISTNNLFAIDLSPLATHEELKIIRKLLMYPMVFEGAVHTHEPHRITFYLMDLAEIFHSYYHDNKVLTEDSRIKKARLYLVEAVRQIVANGLEILGVSAPDRM